MPLVCLIGRHGSGKSTLGQALAGEGYKHISVGLLRRLASSNEFPSDVPAVLMLALRRATAGAALSSDVARKLVRHASQFENVVLDGFPASLEHLALLPADSVFVVVWSPRAVRAERLLVRSESSKRLWTPGRNSERETILPLLIRQLRKQHSVLFFPNRLGAISTRCFHQKLALPG